MNHERYFKLRINEENKVWRKYFTFAERFIYDGGEIEYNQIHTHDITKGITIEALGNNGEVIREESSFTKEKMSEFCDINRVLLIRSDIIDFSTFEQLSGISFKKVSVDGNFSHDYFILEFDCLIDCVNWQRSKKEAFEFFSTLILDRSKIPENVDGFFLDKWDNYGKYYSIVNEKLKEKLLTLEKSKDFLIFDELEII